MSYNYERQVDASESATERENRRRIEEELNRSPRNIEAASPTGMASDFGMALAWMRRGWHVTRPGWNGASQWLAIQTPDWQSKMRLPYIYIRTVHGELVPWAASQTDLLAMDWEVVPKSPSNDY